MRLPVMQPGTRTLERCAGQLPFPAAESSSRGLARVVHVRNPARLPLMSEAISVHREHMKASAELARQLGI
ncbi:hypothetical protein [uncultured Hydrogenophaga sp.]|uniref:hypothetical protein n=1 Tax=uncultured Hydrogenophaga sp. TaxID=199683 RepID=UPI00265E1AE6|nr:hypothetical protein [uncultured Hydrogenophaga sp.]